VRVSACERERESACALERARESEKRIRGRRSDCFCIRVRGKSARQNQLGKKYYERERKREKRD